MPSERKHRRRSKERRSNSRSRSKSDERDRRQKERRRGHSRSRSNDREYRHRNDSEERDEDRPRKRRSRFDDLDDKLEIKNTSNSEEMKKSLPIANSDLNATSLAIAAAAAKAAEIAKAIQLQKSLETINPTIYQKSDVTLFQQQQNQQLAIDNDSLAKAARAQEIQKQIAAQLASVSNLLQYTQSAKDKKAAKFTLLLDEQGREIDAKGNLVKSGNVADIKYYTYLGYNKYTFYISVNMRENFEFVSYNIA